MPSAANIRLGRPAPAMGPGTGLMLNTASGPGTLGTITNVRNFRDRSYRAAGRGVVCLPCARDGHHEMFGSGANGERVHSCTHSRVSHMAKSNNHRMEWAL